MSGGAVPTCTKSQLAHSTINKDGDFFNYRILEKIR